MTVYAVYVPKPDTYAGRTIRTGSGIVGVEIADTQVTSGQPANLSSKTMERVRAGIAAQELADQPTILISYEGNVYDAVNLRRFQERLLHAAGRLHEKYPTSAMMGAPAGDLIKVGDYDYGTKTLVRLPEAEAVLTEWTKGSDAS